MHMTNGSATETVETVETVVPNQQELMTIQHDNKNPTPVWIQISDT